MPALTFKKMCKILYYRQASQGKWKKRNAIEVGLQAEVAY